MDTNVNLAECIVRQSKWGETLITNICSGSTQTLPWQLGEWAGAGLGGVISVVLILGTLVVAIIAAALVRDIF